MHIAQYPANKCEPSPPPLKRNFRSDLFILKQRSQWQTPCISSRRFECKKPFPIYVFRILRTELFNFSKNDFFAGYCTLIFFKLLSKILIIIGGKKHNLNKKNKCIRRKRCGNKKIWENWEKWENLGNLGKRGNLGKMGKMGKMGNLGKYREKVTEKFPVGSLSQRVGNPSSSSRTAEFDFTTRVAFLLFYSRNQNLLS